MKTERLLQAVNKMVSLSESSFDLLLSCAKQKEYSKGQCLLNEGQVCTCLYFVESGWLRTFINQDGKEVNTNFTFEGSFTGNIKSLKQEIPSQCIIEAGESCLIKSFNKKDLLALYTSSPEIELLCRKILGTFLIESNEQIDFYKLLSPSERYYFLIKNKPEMIQRLPLSHLASYIGVARETLSRIRKGK